jgi:uncharacterized membrane protein YqjE
MANYIKWYLAMVACTLAACVLVPLSLVIVWLARLAHRGQDNADIQLLYAMANLRVARGRKGTRR